MAKWRHVTTEIWVIIGSGNGLLPDGTKWISEPMLTYISSVEFCGTHQRPISQEVTKISICKMSRKYTCTWKTASTSLRCQWVKTYQMEAFLNSNPPLSFIFNSLWPTDTIWRHRTGSTMAQVMACCLTAPSHYLNQHWLIISEVQWLSTERIFTRDTSAINHQN